MTDYSKAKNAIKSNYPENSVDAEEWSRLEPVLTPDIFRRRFLFGIPLVSPTMNPITKKYDIKTTEDLRDSILRAISQIEMDTSLDIYPVQREEKHPFDRNLLQQYGYFRVEHKPIMSVTELSVRPGSNENIYVVPNEWIDAGYFAKGQLNIVPIVPAYSTSFITAVSGSGAVFLQILSGAGWVPTFWCISYTSGFPDGKVPRLINELIGCYAAIDVLSEMAALYRSSSHSIGMDGMSQSVSGPGPQVYDVRINKLEERRKNIVGKLKGLYGNKFIMTNI